MGLAGIYLWLLDFFSFFMGLNIKLCNGSFIDKTLVRIRIIILVVFFCEKFSMILIKRIEIVPLVWVRTRGLKIILFFLDGVIMLNFPKLLMTLRLIWVIFGRNMLFKLFWFLLYSQRGQLCPWMIRIYRFLSFFLDFVHQVDSLMLVSLRLVSFCVEFSLLNWG